MSRFCDMIVTINREDEARAKTFHCPRVEYIHGIGVNTDRFSNRNSQNDIRAELGLSKEDFLVLSVGELNENKNQQVIIQAIAELTDPQIHYLLCGKGDQREKLEVLAKKLGVADNVHFLGYRKDVLDICAHVEIFAHPVHREGLGLAPLEAMSCGLPLVTSDSRGLRDYMENGKTGFLCDSDDVAGFTDAIQTLRLDAELCSNCGQYNKETMKPYCLEYVKEEVRKLFKEFD
jgi:glycosyltransferase EpsD